MFKKCYKKQYLIPFLLAFVFVMVPVTLVYAQGNGTSISGDEICGGSASTKCTLNDLKTITSKVLTFVIGIGLPLTIIFITYRFVMAWFALQQGNANAYKEALAKSRDAAIGFFLIVALAGGLLFTLLKFLGVKGGFLESLPFLSTIINVLVPHAYAQASSTVTVAVVTCDSAFSLLGVCSLYDFILSILRLVMRFFIYPALIVIWVWTGFAFVTAQGNPGKLSKAKKWLMWAVVTTLVIFMLQMFLLAARGTVQKILYQPSFTPSTISLNTYTLPSVMLDVFGVEKAYAQASYSNEGRNAVLAQSPILESNCNATNMGVACIVSGRGDSGKCAERDVGVESMRYYCRSDRAGAACPTGQTSYVTGNGTACLPDAEVQRLIQAAEERYQSSAAGQLNSNGSQSTTNTNTQQPSGAAPSAQAASTAVVAVATCDSAFNLLGVCSLYDFILSILRLVMRFFIYPALIVIWVWTGFAFVTAQGNPEGLNKAKKWLMWAFVTTLVIFMLQAFLVAARGTVQKILPVAPASQTTNTNTNTNSNSNNAPAPGTPGAVCTKPNGMYGRTGANGGCF